MRRRKMSRKVCESTIFQDIFIASYVFFASEFLESFSQFDNIFRVDGKLFVSVTSQCQLGKRDLLHAVGLAEKS